MVFKTALHIDKSDIYYSELKIKHLKILFKCLLGDEDIDKDVLIFNLNSYICNINQRLN